MTEDNIPAPLRPDYDADDYTPKQLLDAIQFLLEGLATRDVFDNDEGLTTPDLDRRIERGYLMGD